MNAPDDRNSDTARERRILLGLACEWELAAEDLEACYRERLQRPVFRLSDASGRLGQWDADKREISLNRHLADTQPWDEVRDVLRHEMAHQLAQTVLSADGQTPHGPAFQQACLMLRADPTATAQHTLHVRLAIRASSDVNPCHGRIRKLLALARSPNANEAEAAMLKAHELMARHHITTITEDFRRNFASIFLGRPALRHFREMYFLANLIQDFYYVQGIWVPAFVVAKGKMGRVLEISGTPANLTQAGYVYAFVQAYIDRRWAELTSGRRMTRGQKSDFAVGLIEGFRDKLERERLSKADAAERALICRSDPRLSAYLQKRYPQTRRIQRGGGQQDMEAYGHGRRIGEKMILHRGICQPTHRNRRPLPPA